MGTWIMFWVTADETYLHPADFQLYQQHTTVDRKLSIASMRSTRPELFLLILS